MAIYKNKLWDYIYPSVDDINSLIYIKFSYMGIFTPLYEVWFIYKKNIYNKVWKVKWGKIKQPLICNTLRKIEDKWFWRAIKSYNDDELVFDQWFSRSRKWLSWKVEIPYLSFIDWSLSQEVVDIWRQHVMKINKFFVMRRTDFIYCFSFLDQKKIHQKLPAKYYNIRGKISKNDATYRDLYHGLQRIYTRYLKYLDNIGWKDTIISWSLKKVINNWELDKSIEIYKRIISTGFNTVTKNMIDATDKQKYPRSLIKKPLEKKCTL